MFPKDRASNQRTEGDGPAGAGWGRGQVEGGCLKQRKFHEQWS